MRKVFCFFLLTIFSISQVFSQDAFNYSGIYRWTASVKLERSYLDGSTDNDLDDNPIFSITNQLFWVVNTQGNDAIIKILYYTKKNGDLKNGNASDNFFTYNFDGSYSAWDSLRSSKKKAKQFGDNQSYFKVPISILNSKALPYTRIDWSLSVGALNFPFKYRFQKGYGDFSGSFNFGTGVGLLIPHDSAARWNYTILAGFSISQINIDSVSATRNWKGLTSSNNFAAFSFSIGMMLQNNKVQVGVFFGWDRLGRLNNAEYGWIYQGKPWVSIGLGYSIFAADNKTDKSGTTTQK
jgi:hypothetical protein